MHSITHIATLDTRHTFDLNVRLCETAEGVLAWSSTQDGLLTLRANGTTRATVDSDVLISFRIDGVRKRLEREDIDRLMEATDSFATSETFFDRELGTMNSAVEVVRAVFDGQTYAIAADSAAGTIGTYAITATGDWSVRDTLRDDANTGFGGVSAMASAVVGDDSFIVTASATENTLTVFGLTEGGVLTETARLSMADGLPIAAPSDVEIVEGAGGTFIILASAGSDSLTAVSLNANGGIAFVDQIIDSRDTRFDSVIAMDWITRDGRILGAVAGADGGLSIIELLPSGRFIVHATLEDTTDMGLSGINDVLLRITPTGLDLTVISASEESVTRFAIDVSGGVVMVSEGTATGTQADDVVMGGSGDDRLHGEGGADVLVDGAGTDSMYGGAGADLFVLDADGAFDLIYDFDLSEDRLDLSAWGMLYSVDQLVVQPRSNGATIRFGQEELRIFTHDGQRLTAADLTNAMILGAQHVTVWEPLGDGPEAPLGLEITGTNGGERLEGGVGDDTILAMGGDDIILASGGDDVIDGGAGRDVLSAEEAAGGMTLALTGDVTGVEDLRGSDYADVLVGNGADNLLEGGAGHDTLRAGGGSDTLIGGAGGDAFNGGGGLDWVSYAAHTGPVHADLSGDTDNSGGAAGDSFAFVENLMGGSGHDTLIGDDAANVLWGGAGNDSLDGGAGNDQLTGGDGNDTLMGGGGDDVILGGAGDDLLTLGGADPDLLELYL